MRNITEVRKELCDVFSRLKSGDMSPKTAVEINNCAGKIINSVKLELDFYALTKEAPDIPFITDK